MVISNEFESEPKRMSLREFREKGVLQEVNRQFFHPLGLSLFVNVDKDGHTVLEGILDSREDPEGVLCDDLSDQKYIDNAQYVEDLKRIKTRVRMIKYGFGVQPIGSKLDEVENG